MKLQYKNNQWYAGEVPEPLPDHPDKGYMLGSYGTTMYKEQVQEEQEEIDEKNYQALQLAISQFIPIAPNDQDKAGKIICKKYNQGAPISFYDIWQPEIGKLYDSGDLEFELEERRRYKLENGLWAGWVKYMSEYIDLVQVDKFESKQFWVLKNQDNRPDKVQPSEEEKELSEMISKVHDCAEGRYELTGQDCYEIQSLLCQLQDGTIKQLQSRIAELEEQRRKIFTEGTIAMWNEIQKHPYSSAVPNPVNPYLKLNELSRSNQDEFWSEIENNIIIYTGEFPKIKDDTKSKYRLTIIK